jgi:hypothetical protein
MPHAALAWPLCGLRQRFHINHLQIFAPLCRVSDQGQSHGVSGWVQHGEAKGGVSMAFLLTDLLLFSALAVWVTGMVIAIASLLS